MKYGYFDNNKKEYIITNPKLPVKWINYIGSLKFGGFVDHTGGALLCKGDPALNRITNYIHQLPNSSFKGETLYLRIKKENNYIIISPFYTPVMQELDIYQCHIGLSYMKIVSEIFNIRTEVTIFIPENHSVEIRNIKVINKNREAVEIDVIPVVEYSHFDAVKQFTNQDWVPQTMQSEMIKNQNKILLQYAFMNRNMRINYFTSNFPVSSFETDREIFLGKNGYGTWTKPCSLMEPELGCTTAVRGNNIAALLHHLGKLKENEERELSVFLGQEKSINDIKNTVNFFCKNENIDTEYNKLSSFWKNYLSVLNVNTESEEFNTMINIHNPRQCFITTNWSRYLSLYQTGTGARGLGFRDTSQDILYINSVSIKKNKELILKLTGMQKEDGSVMHQFNPLNMVGSEGDAREFKDRPKYYGDDHLWLILAVCEYIKETGDVEILKTKIPFYKYKKQKSNYNTETLQNESNVYGVTVLTHLENALSFTINNTGNNGLPLLGFADWNDTVNLKPPAESIFVANLFGKALKEMVSLLEFLKIDKNKEKYEKYYNKMKKCLNFSAWDGKWYIRYIDSNEQKMGSNTNKYSKIYANAQSWSVISGFADRERAEKALESVYKYLNTKNGIKLSVPGFNSYDPEIGGITTYPPGAKENGGIFLHSNPWVIIAESIMGNGDRAYKYYEQINPVKKNNVIEEYECEPYCWAQNILGDEHVKFGLGRNSWLTGTAAWAYIAAVKYILGIRPSYRGLIIDPCIPSRWNGFKAEKFFRGKKFVINVLNPDHVCKAVKELKINSKKIEGNLVLLEDCGDVNQIDVMLGK